MMIMVHGEMLLLLPLLFSVPFLCINVYFECNDLIYRPIVYILFFCIDLLFVLAGWLAG